MLTVRFPTGVSVVYNDAQYLRYANSAWVLYADDPDKGGRWIASLQPSAGCIVESVPACRVSDGQESDKLEQLKAQLGRARSVSGLQRIKRAWAIR